MHHSTTLAEVTMTYRSSRPGPGGRRHALRIPRRTLGMDLGDRRSDLCLLDEAGRVMARDRVRTTRRELESALTEVGPCRVIMEVGTHSPWISRLAHELGNEVIVANPRKVQLIAKGTRKNDRKDAMLLARLGRADTELLSPIQHRGEVAQWLLLAVRQRAGLVRGRSALINQVRGLVKSLGERVRGCSPGGFPRRARQDLSADMVAYLQPTLRCIEMLTSTIREFDRSIEDPDGALAPVVQRLRQITGVGPVLALTFVLTIDDPERFKKSRDVGPFLGLVPRQAQSGGVDKELRITKAGNTYLRALLVNAAQHIIHRGPETRLQQFGRRLAERGGRAANMRAIIAVARRLAITMHRIWVTGEDYRP